MGSTTKPAILAVHGAGHRASHWSMLTPELAALGFETYAADNPSADGKPGVTQADDVAHILKTLLPLVESGREVVLLAHSYGGQVAGGAIKGLSLRSRRAQGQAGGVLGIIFLAALIGASGDDLSLSLKAAPPHCLIDNPSKGLMTIAHSALYDMFYGPDTPVDIAETAMKTLGPQSLAAICGIVADQGWPEEGYDGRRAYIRCAEDHALPPHTQDHFIEIAGGKDKLSIRTLEGSGHSPFLSRPKELAEVVDVLVQEFAVA